MHTTAVLLDGLFVTVQPALVVPNEAPRAVVNLRRLKVGKMLIIGQKMKPSLTQKVCMCPSVGILKRVSREVPA